MHVGTCEWCGATIDHAHGYARAVSGWEVIRAQGGANAIAMRQEIPGVVVHAMCFESMKRHGVRRGNYRPGGSHEPYQPPQTSLI